MKYRIAALCLLVIAFACLKVFAAPTIDATTAFPNAISMGTNTTIVITSSITDPSVIATSVNLLRINANGTSSIIGRLNDSGLNADAVSGDKVFTASITLNEPTTGQVRLQVSAAFRGLLKRVMSSALIVTVADAVNVIGPEGGVLQVEQPDSSLYGVRVSFPPDAVSNPTLVFLSSFDTASLPVNPRMVESRLPAFRLEPSDITFNQPVLIQYPLDDNDADGLADGTSFPLNAFQLYRTTDSATMSTLERVPTIYDPSQSYLNAQTKHFSTWYPRAERWKTGTTVTYIVDRLPTNVQAAGSLYSETKDAFKLWEDALQGSGITFKDVTDEDPLWYDIQIDAWDFCRVSEEMCAEHGRNTLMVGGPQLFYQSVALNSSSNRLWIGKPYLEPGVADQKFHIPFLRILAHELSHSLGISYDAQRGYPSVFSNPPDQRHISGTDACDNCAFSFTTLSSTDVSRIRAHYGLPNVSTESGTLTFNGYSNVAGVWKVDQAQTFEVTVDLSNRNVSLFIDGVPISNAQNRPFYQPASTLSRVAVEFGTTGTQVFAIDDIRVTNVASGVSILNATFNGDSVGSAPHSPIDGNASNGTLASVQQNGKVLVVNSSGNLSQKPVEISQFGGANDVSLLMYVATSGGQGATAGKWKVSWRSLMKDPGTLYPSMNFVPVVIRGNDSGVIATLEYR